MKNYLLNLRGVDKEIPNDERGDGEIITMLFFIPLLLAIIFTIIDISMYFSTRSSIQNAVRDGARQVALYGGNSKSIPLNTTGKNVNVTVKKKITALGNVSNVTTSCTPSKATSLNQEVSCTASYQITSITGGFPSILGLGSIFNHTLTITETFNTETYYAS